MEVGPEEVPRQNLLPSNPTNPKMVARLADVNEHEPEVYVSSRVGRDAYCGRTHQTTVCHIHTAPHVRIQRVPMAVSDNKGH